MLFSLLLYFPTTIVWESSFLFINLKETILQLLLGLVALYCLNKEITSIENLDFSKLTWDFWGRITGVRQPRKICAHRSLRQRRFLVKSFCVPVGNTFDRKWRLHRSVFLENIFDWEVQVRFSCCIRHVEVLLSLHDALWEILSIKYVVYCIIGINGLLLSSFKSLKNVIYLMYIYT